jgi:hypothetical protein
MMFVIMKDIMDIYTLLYCVCVSTLSLYVIMTGEYDRYFDVLQSITLNYMCITFVRYLIEFCDYKMHFIEKLIDCNDTDNAAMYKKLKRERDQSLIYIVHHIGVISLFSHIPSEENLKMCMEKYTKIHLFEISTIIMIIITTPILKKIFFNGQKHYDVILKLLFMVLFLGIRVCWLLPQMTFEFYTHDFGIDTAWKVHIWLMLCIFWVLHIYWGSQLIKKFVSSICSGELTCRRSRDHIVKTQ